MHTDPIEVVTPAASLPVTLAELKSHLQLNRSDDDTDLTLFLASAIETWEFETKRPAIATVYRQHTHFPAFRNPLRLGRGKVTALGSITYTDAAGSSATLADQRNDFHGPIGLIYPPTGGWPAVDPAAIRPVKVQYTAGWANAAAVPADVKVAIRMLAAHWYGNRDAFRDSAFDMRETPEGFRRVCNKYRLCVGIV
jgi:uncharacterized phiE125 gp8 family phage protein